MLRTILAFVAMTVAQTSMAEEVSPRDITLNFAKIDMAANLVLENLGPSFTGTPNGHIQTDVAAAGAIAGLALLRETVKDLDRMTPGDVVISDVHEGQLRIQSFMAHVAGSMGLDPQAGWTGPASSEAKPMMDTLELTSRLEGPFLRACAQANLPPQYHSYAAALAAMKLVSAGQQMRILDPNDGKYLAFYYMVAGSKTVPRPVSP